MFRLTSRKYWDEIKHAIKPIYTAVNAAAARSAFDELTDKWGQRYPAVVRLAQWPRICLQRASYSRTPKPPGRPPLVSLSQPRAYTTHAEQTGARALQAESDYAVIALVSQ